MLDSAACGACHHDQYDEWAGSMHAYSADDPVFRALNARMQAESPPEQQAFCLTCHAPVAVKLGRPIDFASLDANPVLKGVTCFFCHATETAPGVSNNPLVLGKDGTMRAAIRDPINPKFHKAAYSPLLDGDNDGQSALCGPCHDIVTVHGAHIERTFREWAGSNFALGADVDKKRRCASCHMLARKGRAAIVADAPIRDIHDHTMVGVDLALTMFPGKEDQRARTQAFLDEAVHARLCVTAAPDGATIDVALHTETVGHAWPSGSNQDRRAWVEVSAYVGDTVVFQSGQIADDVAVASVQDPTLFLLRDYDYDTDDKESELFWRTARFEAKQLPPLAPTGGADNTVHAVYHSGVAPDRVVSVVKIRPIDSSLLQEAEKGGLDRRAIDPITTFELRPTRLEWRATDATSCSN